MEAEEPEVGPSQHLPQVCTDGSFAEESPGQGFIGYGVWFGPLDPRNMAIPLEGPTQTNNRAELTAYIAALKAVPLARPLRVVTDSKYVYDGATRYLNCWFLLGQHVTNRDLWEALRDSLSACSAPNPL